jgi:hypothetical protein
VNCWEAPATVNAIELVLTAIGPGVGLGVGEGVGVGDGVGAGVGVASVEAAVNIRNV